MKKYISKALETSDARHLMILFRDLKCQYRALYMYDPDAERLHKLTGNGISIFSIFHTKSSSCQAVITQSLSFRSNHHHT